jgi:hypothetical protein
MRNRGDVVVVGLLALGIAALLAWPQPDRATRENFDRIRKGMSRAEVESILGPPGNYRIDPQCLPSLKQLWVEGSEHVTYLEDWITDSAWVSVALDEPRGVVGTRFIPLSGGEQGRLGSLLRRVKYECQRWSG